MSRRTRNAAVEVALPPEREAVAARESLPELDFHLEPPPSDPV